MADPAKTVERTYLVLTLLTTLASSFIWGINTIFLLDAGLNNAEAFAAVTKCCVARGPAPQATYFRIKSSALESFGRLAVVIADQGITGAVPAPDWNRIATQMRSLGEAAEPARSLLDGLREMSAVLARALPPTEDNPDELPNRPRSHP